MRAFLAPLVKDNEIVPKPEQMIMIRVNEKNVGFKWLKHIPSNERRNDMIKKT